MLILNYSFLNGISLLAIMCSNDSLNVRDWRYGVGLVFFITVWWYWNGSAADRKKLNNKSSESSIKMINKINVQVLGSISD